MGLGLGKRCTNVQSKEEFEESRRISMKYPTKVITALLKEGAVLVVGWGDCWCRGESSLPHKTLGVIKEAEDEWIVRIEWLFDGVSDAAMEEQPFQFLAYV